MKTKRKVYLSGKWWYPVRNYELTSTHNYQETIRRIQELPKYDKIAINRKDENGVQEFFLNKRIGRSSVAYISGHIMQIDGTVYLTGKIGIGLLEFLLSAFIIFAGIIFLAHAALQPGSVVIGTFDVIFFLLCFFGITVSYGIMTSQCDAKFWQMVRLLHEEKTKNI